MDADGNLSIDVSAVMSTTRGNATTASVQPSRNFFQAGYNAEH